PPRTTPRLRRQRPPPLRARPHPAHGHRRRPTRTHLRRRRHALPLPRLPRHARTPRFLVPARSRHQNPLHPRHVRAHPSPPQPAIRARSHGHLPPLRRTRRVRRRNRRLCRRRRRSTRHRAGHRRRPHHQSRPHARHHQHPHLPPGFGPAP